MFVEFTSETTRQYTSNNKKYKPEKIDFVDTKRLRCPNKKKKGKKVLTAKRFHEHWSFKRSIYPFISNANSTQNTPSSNLLETLFWTITTPIRLNTVTLETPIARNREMFLVAARLKTFRNRAGCSDMGIMQNI